MSKYNQFQENKKPEEKPYQKMHPIWRGVGFAMMIFIPLFSYASSEVLIQQNQKMNYFPWPYDILAKPGEFLYNGDPLLYFKILVTLTIMFILFALFTLVTVAINSAFGSPRYGPYDLPPINAKVRKKSR
jgi:hypothetical protein